MSVQKDSGRVENKQFYGVTEWKGNQNQGKQTETGNALYNFSSTQSIHPHNKLDPSSASKTRERVRSIQMSNLNERTWNTFEEKTRRGDGREKLELDGRGAARTSAGERPTPVEQQR